MVFQWLAIPWLQAEIDAFVARYNMTKPRYNRRVLAPHGAPDLIFENPNLFDTLDFIVSDMSFEGIFVSFPILKHCLL